MELLVVLAALVAICASSAIPPAVPTDNSHYVEGQSRYIWMPDGDGFAHLVDLEEPVDYTVLNNLMRNGANNQYWLYTRRNPNSPQFLVYSNANSVTNSNFCSSCPTKIIAHGWTNNGNSPLNPTVTAAFLAAGDFNVIVVDWSEVASSNYLTAAMGVPSIGQHVGDFLTWLMMTTGGNWDVHLIGYSLGAHVVGNAGRQVHGLAARVTGLDPAGPLWWGSANALTSTDGRYVEVIHTDGGILGILYAIGDADFYPNGGIHPQPGCTTSACSHDMSYQLLAASIVSNHLVGRQCGDFTQAINNQCTGTTTLHLGNSLLDKRGSGMFGLTTGAVYPY